MPQRVRALTIAGSDSSGGAGIQADLKTFSALGAYGMTAITALTVQNTQGVRDVHPVPPGFVADQVDAVFEDVGVDAVKIGMLGGREVVAAVAERLAHWRPPLIVLDTVMVAKSGHRLLEADAVEALRERLIPLADLITPNLPEAADLLGEEAPADLPGMRETAGRLLALGPGAVLLKGGHLPLDDATDVFVNADGTQELGGPRVPTANTHGTGCTLSAAIAAIGPRVPTLASAARLAKDYMANALGAADDLAIGQGHGPVDHLAAFDLEGRLGGIRRS